MNFTSLLNTTIFCALMLWIGFFAVVGYKLTTGEINSRGILKDREGNFSPGRLQLLAVTLMGSGHYLILLFSNLNQQVYKFPEISRELLLLIGGSHICYLGGKSAPQLMRTILRHLKP